jgi:hypothetical protein
VPARTRGVYVTRGRGLELEREIHALEQRLTERVRAAEARADAAAARCDELLRLLNSLVDRRSASPIREAANG